LNDILNIALSTVSSLKAILFTRQGRLFLSQLSLALISLAIGKVIAVYIAPEIFGQYALIMTGIAFVSSLFFSPATFSFNYYLQIEKHRIVVSKYLLFFAGIAVLSIVPTYLLFRQELISGTIAYLVIALIAAQGIYSLLTNYFNVNNRNDFFILLQWVLNVINLLIIILAINTNWITPETLLCALLIGHLMAIFVGSWGLRKDLFHLLHFPSLGQQLKTVFWDTLSYGSPLICLAIFNWVVNYLDKWMISHLMTDADVGFYTAGYGLGAKVFLALIAPFLMLLTPKIYQMRKENLAPINAQKVTLEYLKVFYLIGIPVLSTLCFFRHLIGELLLSITYQEGFIIIVLIAFAYLLLTTIQFFEVSFYAWAKSKYVLYHYIVGAAVNIFFNLLLIPIYGIQGAALATIFSFAIQLLVVLFLYHKLIRIPPNQLRLNV